MPTGGWGGVDHTTCVGVIAGCHQGGKTHAGLQYESLVASERGDLFALHKGSTREQ